MGEIKLQNTQQVESTHVGNSFNSLAAGSILGSHRVKLGSD